VSSLSVRLVVAKEDEKANIWAVEDTAVIHQIDRGKLPVIHHIDTGSLPVSHHIDMEISPVSHHIEMNTMGNTITLTVHIV
jgi:hypothetical protein